MTHLVLPTLLALLEPAAADGFGRETTSPVRGEIDASHDKAPGDGVYGRFDGDLDLGIAAGFGYASERDALLSTRLTLHYFSLAGIFVDYADALGGSAESQRTLAFGADVRPLFVPRWSQNMEQGPPILDLWLDSISLSLGAFFAQPAARDFGDERGFATSLGFGIPFTGLASGPWLELRGHLFFPDEGETHALAVALLSWHFIASTPFNNREP